MEIESKEEEKTFTVGTFANNMMQHLKEAVKAKNIEAINKIIAHGVN